MGGKYVHGAVSKWIDDEPMYSNCRVPRQIFLDLLTQSGASDSNMVA